MFQKVLTVPEIGLIAGTRMALGIGIGLLIAGRLSRDARKAAGIALTVVGAATTVPLAVQVIGRGKSSEARRLSAA